MSTNINNIFYVGDIESKPINSSGNILSSFMESDPKKSLLFTRQKVTPKESLFISQITSNCSIFFNKMRNPCKLSSCEHIFCKSCIIRTFKNSNKCPMCRAKFQYLINIIYK